MRIAHNNCESLFSVKTKSEEKNTRWKFSVNYRASRQRKEKYNRFRFTPFTLRQKLHGRKFIVPQSIHSEGPVNLSQSRHR